MKAIRIHEFGSYDVPELDEIDIPKQTADEVLIKVYASAVIQ
ncbi:hypothetical protein [Mucilaginibacter agri]|nr:hypothetical protein [Mucilaginibacter agri]